MTIFTQDRIRGTSFLEEYEAPLADVLGVTAEDTLIRSPFKSLTRMGELEEAEQGKLLDLTGRRASPDSPLVDAETARQRVKDAGVQLEIPDNGIRQRALDILIDRKHDEIRREAVLSRAPTGVLSTTARIGTMLAASALDPLNVASAFIPVVGEARYGSMLARAGSAIGRAGVRARIGALEGAIGQAVVEPIVYSAAQREQADYDLSDSLLSIGLGTALGGGLHMGLGAAADAITKGATWRTARPVGAGPRAVEAAGREAREAALRASVSQAMTGRHIDVEPIVTYAGGGARFGEEMRFAGPEEVAPGYVRLYHGGVEPTSGGSRFVTPDLEYARHFRAVNGPNEVHFVDVPEGSSVLEGLRDEVSGRLQNGEIPESLAKQMRPLGDTRRDFKPTIQPEELQNTAALKYEPDSLAADAARLSNLSESPAFVEHGLGAVEAPTQRMVLDTMFAVAQEPKILDTIVETLPVDVVDVLGGGKLSAKELFHDKAVFLDLLARNGDKPVATGVDAASAAVRVVARATAKEFLPPLREGGGAVEGRAALGTNARVHAESIAASVRDATFDDKLITAVKRNDQSLLPPPPNDLRAIAQAAFAPEAYRLADIDTVTALDAKLKAAPKDEALPDMTLQAAMEDVQALAASLGDPEIVAREMTAYDELAQTADAYGKAVRAAADCGLRRGTA